MRRPPALRGFSPRDRPDIGFSPRVRDAGGFRFAAVSGNLLLQRSEEIERIYGNISGLTRSDRKNILRAYKRKIPRHCLVTPELVRLLSSLSRELKRTMTVLADRRGKIAFVFMGEPRDFPFEKLLGRRRRAKYRLRGFRAVRTDLKGRGLSDSDLVTLANERLDMMASISVDGTGAARRFEYANLVPRNGESRSKWEISSFPDIGRLDINFEHEVNGIEQQLRRAFLKNGGKENREGAVLVGFGTKSRHLVEKSLEELNSLALSAEKVVLDKTAQTRRNADPRYLVGRGKLREISLHAKHLGADTIVFDTDLTPAQASAISDESGLDIVDRSQLIIQIFARHAKTNEGKIQARLAELRYNLPRLKGKGEAFSQLGGGIGTRGPGEKKLEHERRNIRKQIDQLEKQIDGLCRRRENTRKNRKASGIPTLSFVGYTNVGKSTLFNRLTRSATVAQDKLFSTLNPTTRKIMLPGGKHVLMTDTVGFISKLPQELINAFRATLEEIGEADMLIHVADSSDPEVEERIESVDRIMKSIECDDVPTLLVFNKGDKTDARTRETLRAAFPETPVVSAKNAKNFAELLLYIEKSVEHIGMGGKDTDSGPGEKLKRAS